MNKQRFWKGLWSYLMIVAGSALYALAFNWFFAPNSIAYGGVTGVAQAVNALFGAPSIGALIILINVPLFLLGWRLLGGKTLVSSLAAMALSSLFIDLIASAHTFTPMEPLLACIFGGILTGSGLGLVLQQGATTGGTDLCARLLKLKLQWLPMGKLLLLLDLIVIALASAVFRDLHSALYGIVALYLSTLAIDVVLYGFDHAKVAYIISDHPDAISSAIVQSLDRGVTVLHGAGGYSGKEKKVLLCAFKQRQIVALKQVVNECDPTAFLIVCDAHEVLGDGFHPHGKNDI